MRQVKVTLSLVVVAIAALVLCSFPRPSGALSTQAIEQREQECWEKAKRQCNGQAYWDCIEH